jgi:uncharacterized protein
LHPAVQQLLSLQKIDTKVAKVQVKIDAVPKETAEREARLARTRQAWSQLDKTMRDAEERNEELEIKVQGFDNAIKRQEEHRDKAQSPSTYEAAQHQIQYLKEDREKLQNEQLELMELVEEIGPKRETAEALVQAEEASFASYLNEAGELEAELKAKRDTIAKEREGFLEGVKEGQLEIYEGLFSTRESQAVVSVEGNHCGGCYTKITPNDMARLKGNTSMVTCNACGRILYHN